MIRLTCVVVVLCGAALAAGEAVAAPPIYYGRSVPRYSGSTLPWYPGYQGHRGYTHNHGFSGYAARPNYGYGGGGYYGGGGITLRGRHGRVLSIQW